MQTYAQNDLNFHMKCQIKYSNQILSFITFMLTFTTLTSRFSTSPHISYNSFRFIIFTLAFT